MAALVLPNPPSDEILAGLGRRAAPDSRDARFQPPRSLMRAAEPIRRKMWPVFGEVLDQKSTSQCVAFSGKGMLRCTPIRQGENLVEQAIYDWLQLNDEWWGGEYLGKGHANYYEGTSVRAFMRWGVLNGYFVSYEWAKNVEQVYAHIIARGPAMFGTTFTASMATPDRWNYSRFDDGRNSLGGHAYYVPGCDRDRIDPLTSKRGAFRYVNSWSDRWGDKGRAWLTESDVQKLIDDFGEVALPVEKRFAA